MAYINLAPSLKTSRAQAIVTAIGSSGYLDIYSGTQPSDPSVAATGTRLAHCPLSATAGTVSGGVLTFNAITTDSAAVAGTAGYARITTSAGVGIIDADVAVSGASVTINSTAIAAGGPVVISSVVLTEA